MILGCSNCIDKPSMAQFTMYKLSHTLPCFGVGIFAELHEVMHFHKFDYKSLNSCRSMHVTLGPHHTQAKSHDHEIVRAQKESVPWPSQHTLQNNVVWS